MKLFFHRVEKSLILTSELQAVLNFPMHQDLE